MDQYKNLDEMTLAELKQTAAKEDIQGVESFDKKAQVIALITQMRIARGQDPKQGPANVPTQPTNPETPPAPAVPEAPVETLAPANPEAAPELPAETPTLEPAAPEAPVETAPAAVEAADSKAPVSPSQDAEAQQVWKTEVQTIKAMLDSRPKVRTFVPLDLNEKPGSYLPVIFNGYRVDVLKNHYVDIPDVISDIIAESYNQTASVGQDLLLDRVDNRTGRPVSDSMGLRG